ncbi:armadillo-type protein [Syncephalis pseudoplumigaleata]|uniref:Exportin-T n=1 Tax=Syncephalis pseudoplumigaleata TaxID=1712513 RepID=A0A4V1J233_9FUNG|nr:armadillo-type protein [Syncephalis pseudoplumigaleata]|eukprot:RKP27159.1 armadillo-type protein [Syncephalis pseudoplumigaleata]
MEVLEQAVTCALDPNADPQVKAQATSYCEQLRASPDGWTLCLSLFIREPKSSQEARLFALQVVEEMLSTRFNELQPDQVGQLRQAFLSFIQQEYASNAASTTTENEPIFIRNKFAHTLVLLFARTYLNGWSSFFTDLLSLLAAMSPSSSGEATLAPRLVDFLMRVWMSIDEECVSILVPHSKEELDRNTHIKDRMREGDIQLLAQHWLQIIDHFYNREPQLVAMCLKVVGAYISWIDIGLIFNDQFMNRILGFLSNEALCMPAVDTITEIIGKGMKPEDKLGVIQALNISHLLSKLSLCLLMHCCIYHQNNEELIERVACLCNAAGIALCEVYQLSEQSPGLREAASVQIESLWPYMLQFLTNEYDDTSVRVLPFVNDSLQMIKRQAKQSALSDGIKSFLQSLLEAIVRKMQYDPDTEWTSALDDEDAVAFLELRQSLKTHFEVIASIDDALFTGYVHGLITSTLQEVSAGSRPVWTRVELAMQLSYWLGEASREQMRLFNKGAPTPLADVVACLFESNVHNYPHASVLLPYFECAIRYVNWFVAKPQHILPVLTIVLIVCFISGLHHPDKRISRRAWYLFARFVKALKKQLAPYTDDILKSMQDLFTIQVEEPVEDEASTFDSQVYIFETAGSLISAAEIDASQQAVYLETALSPILESIQQYATASPDHPVAMLHLSHLIMAVGAVAKGFPTVEKDAELTEPWVAVFKRAVELILGAVDRMKTVAVVREAARYSFSRLVNCLGTQLLSYIPPLISSIIGEGEPTEVSDFLAFLNLVVHKFKPAIGEIIDELFLPLTSRVFHTLEQPVSGTDEALLHNDVRRAYLSFLVVLFSFELQTVLVSPRNQGHANTLCRFVIEQTKRYDDVPTQKLAFSLLCKMVAVWGGTAELAMILPGFDQFLYGEVVPVCFEVPVNPAFNLADGQTQLVFGELATVLKLVHEKQGTQLQQYLQEVYFPSIQCPAEPAQEICQALDQLDTKQFRTFYKVSKQASSPMTTILIDWLPR